MQLYHTLYLDIETRCELVLAKVGVYRYSEHESFAVLMCAWALDDGPVHVAEGVTEISAIPYLGHPGTTHVAHNAQFERVALSTWRGARLPADLAVPALWNDTMARAAMAGLPQQLGKLAASLRVSPKDSAGTQLINMFSKPRRAGGWNTATTHPEEWRWFVEYCRQDVETLREVDRELPPLPGREREVWILDQQINDCGLAIDVGLAQACAMADNRGKRQAALALFEAGVDNPRSVQQLQTALSAAGCPLPDLRAATVAEALARPDLPAAARRILRGRVRLANSSTAKFPAMLAHTQRDGRFRGGFRYAGAHTGRWSGRGIQLQNLPRASVEDPAEVARRILRGEPAKVRELKAMLRHCIMGPLTVLDYSAIEARVIAWLAGEKWALDAFAAGRDIYTETARRMGGLTRQQGKTAVLALGYQGGTGSLRVMGFEGSDAEAQLLVTQWRTANPRIVELWQALERGAMRAVNRAHLPAASPERTTQVGSLTFAMRRGDLHLGLPSGRPLVYRHFRSGRDGLEYRDGLGVRINTYGGRLAENATQAVARDVLAHAMLRLRGAGYQIIGHVHDEVIIEGEHDLDAVRAVMTKPPAWAEGLPLDAGGYTADRYRKD